MTVNWYRPSQCILVSITFSSFLVTFGCLACGYLLHFAPEEPSRNINGGNYTFIPAICLAAASGLSILAVVFGCCGIFKDSKTILIVYALFALLIAVFLLGISCAVLAFMLNGKIKSQVENVVYDDLLSYNESSGKENIFSHIQRDFKCCGVIGTGDWEDKNTTWWHLRNSTTAEAPSSCCSGNISDVCTRNNSYSQGCLHALFTRMEYAVFPMFGFCVALSLLEVAMAILACYGAMLIKRYQNYDVL